MTCQLSCNDSDIVFLPFSFPPSLLSTSLSPSRFHFSPSLLPLSSFSPSLSPPSLFPPSSPVRARGEGLSGYYRMITKHGDYVWLQTRATMMFDSHTGEPSYIVCMNFVIR